MCSKLGLETSWSWRVKVLDLDSGDYDDVMGCMGSGCILR